MLTAFKKREQGEQKIMSLISVRNLTIHYERHIAIENVSFEVEQGDYICIVGTNGSGKSSLIKGLLGLKKLKTGEIVFEMGLKQSQIGYLSQQALIQKDFPINVFEVVVSGCLNRQSKNPFYTKKQKQRAISMMQKLSIVEFKNKSFKELSIGQQQRVLLARAFCSAEKVLVLDEPVTGLDPIITSEFYKLINELNQAEKVTIIMISHNVNDAIKYSNKILHLNKKCLFFGSPEEYVNSEVSQDFKGCYHD